MSKHSLCSHRIRGQVPERRRKRKDTGMSLSVEWKGVGNGTRGSTEMNEVDVGRHECQVFGDCKCAKSDKHRCNPFAVLKTSCLISYMMFILLGLPTGSAISPDSQGIGSGHHSCANRPLLSRVRTVVAFTQFDLLSSCRCSTIHKSERCSTADLFHCGVLRSSLRASARE